MVLYHANDLRKISGGKKGKGVKVKRKYLLGGYPTETKFYGKEKRKKVRTKGGGSKIKLLSATYANVAIDKGIVKNKTKNIEIRFNPLPKVMLNILEDGGIVEHLKKHGDFKLEE